MIYYILFRKIKAVDNRYYNRYLNPTDRRNSIIIIVITGGRFQFRNKGLKVLIYNNTVYW